MDAATLKKCIAPQRHSQKGLTLVELLVGMVIGLVLIGGIYQTMLASREAAATRQSISTITDNARFLFDFMARDLRMTGRGYCAGDDGSDCISDRWPVDGSDLEPPIEFDSGSNTLTLRYESFDSSGDPIFIEARYSLAGDEIRYTRLTDTLGGDPRFELPTSSSDGYSDEPLVAGIGALDFEFGEYDRTNHTYNFNANFVLANVGDMSAIRTTVTFLDLQAWGGEAIEVGDEGAISFTVALRNRVARVSK